MLTVFELDFIGILELFIPFIRQSQRLVALAPESSETSDQSPLRSCPFIAEKPLGSGCVTDNHGCPWLTYRERSSFQDCLAARMPMLYITQV